MRTFSSFETFKKSTGSLANSGKTWDSFAWEAAVPVHLLDFLALLENILNLGGLTQGWL